MIFILFVLWVMAVDPSNQSVARPIPLSGDDFILYDPEHPRIREPSDEERLAVELFESYEVTAGPRFNNSEIIKLGIGFAIATMHGMDEVRGVLSVLVWLNVTWRDERLIWDPQSYGGSEQLAIDSSRMWLPDLVMYNSAKWIDSRFLYGTKALVRHDGFVRVAPQTQLYAACQLDLTIFPFDGATCHVKIGSWSYDSNSLNVLNKSDRANFEKYLGDKNWVITSTRLFVTHERIRPVVVSGIHEQQPWQARSGASLRTVSRPFCDVVLVIKMQRKYFKHFYVYTLAPCMFVQLITVVCFWLDPRDREKVKLCLGVILIYLCLFMAMDNEIPRSGSNTLPLISIYLTISMCSTGFILAIQVLLLNLYHRPAHWGPVPNWLRTVVIGWLGKVLVRRHDRTEYDKAKTLPNLVFPETKFARSSAPSQTIGNYSKEEQFGQRHLQSECQKVEGTVNYLTFRRCNKVTLERWHEDWALIGYILDRVIFYASLVAIITFNLVELVWIPYTHSKHPEENVEKDKHAETN